MIEPIIIFIIAMVILVVVNHLREKQKAEQAMIEKMQQDIRRKKYNQLDNAYRRDVEAALDAKTSAGVRSRMSSADSIVDRMTEASGSNLRELAYYKEDRKDMEEYANELERGEWEEKADNMLRDFHYYYTLITYGAFNESDKMLNAKKRCLDILRKYNMSWEGLNIFVKPKEYMKEYFGEDFQPYMTDATELGRVLDAKIAEMRPERIRKQKLIKNIMDLVADQQSIMRSKLLKYPFPDCTEDEIKYTYKELVAKNRLAEIKIEKRYFAMLSDKEVSRRKDKKAE